MKNLEKYKYLILIVLVLATAFYWYEWRPTQIRKECNLQAIEEAKEASSYKTEMYEWSYKLCLRKEGLEK